MHCALTNLETHYSTTALVRNPSEAGHGSLHTWHQPTPSHPTHAVHHERILNYPCELGDCGVAFGDTLFHYSTCAQSKWSWSRFTAHRTPHPTPPHLTQAVHHERILNSPCVYNPSEAGHGYGGSIAWASDLRSKDPRFEHRQEHKKNLWEFFWVKNVVLTHCRCARLLCVYARVRMITYAR